MTSSIRASFFRPAIELACAVDLGRDGREAGRGEPARCAAGAGWDDELGAFGRLDDQRARGDQAGDFGVAKLFQQAEDVAIDGLAPEIVAVVEITAHADGVDARIEGGRVEGDRAPFAVTEDADLGVGPGHSPPAREVDQGEHLLHLVADDCRPSSKAER